VAEEIASSLDSEADWYAEAIRGGSRSPFAAPVSQKDLLDVYTRMFFKQREDGTIDWDAPNEDQRSKLMQGVGIKGYLDVAKAVMQARPKTGVRPLNELVTPPPSALPPYQPPPPEAGPATPPLGQPPEMPATQDMQGVQMMPPPTQTPPPGLAPPPAPPLG
jgi:hypothetical protein